MPTICAGEDTGETAGLCCLSRSHLCCRGWGRTGHTFFTEVLIRKSGINLPTSRNVVTCTLRVVLRDPQAFKQAPPVDPVPADSYDLSKV